MRKLLGLLLCLALLLGCVSAAGETVPALTQDIVVLFTSDVHCGIESGFGYAGLAAVRDQLAKTNHVILVDNGDAIQGEPVGTMTTGEALIDLMNAVGYEVAIPGNHEFDYGMDRFMELTEKANFPYISANFNKNGEPVFDPYVIKEFEGVKVAFVGATTPKTITSSTPKYFQDDQGNFIYDFCQGDTGDALYDAIQGAVDAARAEGADYVVLMGHLGIEESCSPWMSTEVIANTNGIDALLDGHSHSELSQEKVLNKDGEEVLLSACGTKLANVGYLRIAVDGTLSTGLYSWKNDVSVPALLGIENDVSQAVAAATETLSEKLSEVVATSAVDLVVYDPVAKMEDGSAVRLIRNAETNLGDLCADAYRDQSGADIAFVNGGGIRVDIKAGDITLNDILLVHPFGNAMCVVEATGQQILDALEWGAQVTPSESGGFLQVSGLTYEIHTYIPSSCTQDENGLFTGVTGEYRVKNVKVGGEDLVLDKTYTLASHNYMLKNAGDGFTMFQNDPILQDEVMIDNQVLINYITGTLGGVVGEQYANPYGDGRIVAVTEAPAA
ncbi:MAG TPA: bifunctional metallophosphatase/5'-nucleotidase [Candidatus Excrementavichristensenella intestinipullorum]|nr:bifunctional metallophosphatase/5'-nucleotidase [Candidatus Excrementavichristensenella intestinipullorum]